MDHEYYLSRQQPAVPPPPSPPPELPQSLQQIRPLQQSQASADIAYEKYKVKKELRKAIGGAHEVLASAQTIFPFVLFPDSITVDRSKVAISHRSFFRVAEEVSLRIEDILSITANVGPLFGSLQIATRFFGASGGEATDKSYKINWLSRADALRIKHIVNGYLVAKQREIDTSALSSQELAKLFNELGADTSD